MPFLRKPKKREPWFKWAEDQTFRTGLRHKIFYPGGGYYKGDWVQGFRFGKGVKLMPQGLQYEGDIRCNKKNGFGVESRYDECRKKFTLIYIGDFKNNKKDGYGFMHYNDGTLYEGEFQSDKRHGFGRCWFSDGSYYEGYWIKDLEHGYGMKVQANGNRFEGEWSSGTKNGWGIFYHLDSGQKQVGFWENEICTISTMEDIKFRQSALSPTEYPIPSLQLDPDVPCISFLQKAATMTMTYNEGCKLHKYCYKVSSKLTHEKFPKDIEIPVL